MHVNQVLDTTEPKAEGTRKCNTLEDFGYHFNSCGQLRDIETDKPFEFNIYASRSANQKRYEKLGEVVEQHVYKLLEDDGGLLRTTVPVNASDDEPTTFIFRSEDSFTCKKLLLLIHGSGVVRAGQWARRLIINHSLESGSQLPYIKKAKSLGFGVLVLNTNYNCDKKTRHRIRGSCSPEEHFIYVWEHFVSRSQAEHVAIIAHSYGGVVTTRTAAEYPAIMRKTFAVAFTDSAHYRVKSRNQEQQFQEWMKDNVRNWATSSKQLDVPLRADLGDCFTVSAGTSVHEETSWKAFNSVWKFIQKKWNKNWENNSEDRDDTTTATSTNISSKSDTDMTVSDQQAFCTSNTQTTVLEQPLCKRDTPMTLIEQEPFCKNDTQITLLEQEQFCKSDTEMVVLEQRPFCKSDTQMSGFEQQPFCKSDTQMAVLEQEPLCKKRKLNDKVLRPIENTELVTECEISAKEERGSLSCSDDTVELVNTVPRDVSQRDRLKTVPKEDLSQRDCLETVPKEDLAETDHLKTVPKEDLPEIDHLKTVPKEDLAEPDHLMTITTEDLPHTDFIKTVQRENLSQRDLLKVNELETNAPNIIDKHFTEPSDVPDKKTIKLKVRQKKKKTVSQDIRLLFSKKAESMQEK